ncbi:TOPRIM nucleotidyl transferase/hydrolase domain-containing protein [Bradyrhizobium sp. AC87j1]|uniref:TOPRIM nucleotidyl transferase/hydrolase domain-containing protein n=1 Tax=Bradyrhizobium sp. AC87j1 TaxID=2055894 RepID=UPI0011B068F4|nr:TOPRIM nucleotidyl transferase/hydrolase domain-containing protein [Bradyrhizobium sp. AC87j1]
MIVATHSPNLSAWVESKKLLFFPVVPARAGGLGGDRSRGGAAARWCPCRDDAGDRAASDHAGRPSEAGNTCVPLAAFPLDPVERRRADRYLDVTKSAFLFGGRVLLVEGIAEALLLPAMAKKIVLKGDADKLRLFRSAAFVLIKGIDFQPYAKLLLSPLNEVRIADRLVVVTDGHGADVAEGEVKQPAPGATRSRGSRRFGGSGSPRCRYQRLLARDRACARGQR